MKLLTNFFLICILASAQLIHSQTPTFSSNFEDQNTTPENGGSALIELSGGGEITVVPNPDPDSRNSSSYVLRTRQSSGAGRAEYTMSARTPTVDKTYIYHWLRYHPVDMFKDVNIGFCGYNQWKTWPCESCGIYDWCDTAICGQCGSGIFNDFNYLNSTTGRYAARAEPNCVNSPVTIQQGVWNEFTLYINWTVSNKGFWTMWKNDTIVSSGTDVRTLMNYPSGFEFDETCGIRWSNGIYSYWDRTGGRSTDYLTAYVDEIGIYDVDEGYKVADICPTCEAMPYIPTDTLTYRININGSSSATDGWTNYITTWRGETSISNVVSTYGQGSDIDLHIFNEATETTNNSLAEACIPSTVITTNDTWTDPGTFHIYLNDLTKSSTYTFKLLGGTNRTGATLGTQIWTTEGNRDTVFAAGNNCNFAELTDLSPDANGNLTINVATIGGTGYINAIEIIESTSNSSKPNVCNTLNWSTNAEITHVTEYGGNDGAIDLSVSGGFGNYTYAWNNGSTTEDIRGLTATTYYVEITDDSSCTTAANFTVTQPADPCGNVTITATGTVTDETKGDGSGAITIESVTGGSTPYSYLWNNGKTSQSIDGLSEGTYIITVTDNNGCTGSNEFYVDNYDPCEHAEIVIEGTTTPDVLSEGIGAIDIEVTGGTTPYSYLWSNGETTQDISGLTKDLYAVTVTDHNGCEGTSSFRINDIDPNDNTNNLPVVSVNYESTTYEKMVYTLDASESYDPDDDELSYLWSLSEDISSSSLTGPIISILPTGNSDEQVFNITLRVSDGEDVVEETLDLGIYDYNPNASELKILSVEASSYQVPNYPMNMFDNDLSTRWSAEGDGEWTIVELNKKSTLSHFEIAAYNGEERNSYFDIYASDDKENWDLLLENSNTCGFTSNNQAYAMPQTKTSNMYKYVKFVGRKNSINLWNSYTEFKIFGVSETTSAEEVPTADQIVEVYPNPTDDAVYVKSEEDASIKIITMTGSIVHEQFNTSDVSKLNCDLKSGVYFIQVKTSNNKTYTQKLIVR